MVLMIILVTGLAGIEANRQLGNNDGKPCVRDTSYTVSQALVQWIVGFFFICSLIQGTSICLSHSKNQKAQAMKA
ncbi:MAG: hypothetical protein VR65_24110 [Desulfobulbaceae bacterium BRH_c16a]|nr:MAG: hypothetical protein VR65_24110 [Desulfobulbaceae bacterium BRH_c16a]